MNFRRSALVSAAVTAACVLTPSLAQATDYCVNDPVCTLAGNKSYPTLEAALALANMTPVADRVFLGPGTYTAPSTAGYVATPNPVTIVGAGGDQTTLTGPVNTSPVLTVANSSSVVSDLHIVIPLGNDGLLKRGLSMTGGKAKGVAITSDNPLPSLVSGASLDTGSVIKDSSVTLPPNGPSTAIEAGAKAEISNLDIAANQGVKAVGADVQIDRTRMTTNGIGVFATALNARVTNSVIHVPTSGTALFAKDGFSQTNVGLTASNVTAVGDGGQGYGVRAEGSNYLVGVTVDSTVIRGFKSSLIRSAAGAGSASIGVIASDYDPAAVVSNGPGSLFTGALNINADPKFTSATDYHPRPDSPLVDAGDPSPSSYALDVDGKPRVVNGRRDIGAYELQPEPAPTPGGGPDPAPASDPPGGPPAGSAPDAAPAPAPVSLSDTVAPVLRGLKIAPARFTAGRGSSIRFMLSETSTVSVALSRRAAHGSRFTKIASLRRPQTAGAARIQLRKRFAGARLRPGRYVAVLTATDAAGNRSRSYTLSFRVVRG
jgi:hypothetical protein